MAKILSQDFLVILASGLLACGLIIYINGGYLGLILCCIYHSGYDSNQFPSLAMVVV
uniref:Uncharacterized protein n=1 Tax=Arundo donax TaxID=35708 RepID=A0A0A9ACH3_ARUDO